LNFPKKNNIAVVVILKNRTNRDITIGMIMQNGSQTVKEFEFPKSKMADGRQHENR